MRKIEIWMIGVLLVVMTLAGFEGRAWSSSVNFDWTHDPMLLWKAEAKASGNPDGQLHLAPAKPAQGMTPRELACRPDMIAGFKKIWAESGYGWQSYEAAFRVDNIKGNLSVVIAPMNREYHEMELLITNSTIAIAHTHPLISGSWANPPSPQDERSPVPNFVVTRQMLFVTNPTTHNYTRVREHWDRPCRNP